MRRTLLILAGSPATGKTFLINKIKEVFSDTIVISPDDLKESMADKYGFDNLLEKTKLEEKVWHLYYRLLDDYMQVGKKLILTEYPFSDKQKFQFKYLTTNHGYQVVTVCLDADFEVLWRRRYLRDREPTRHLSHLVTCYHAGDELNDREQADSHISKEAFQAIIRERAYANFELGYTIQQDVSDRKSVV